MDSRHFLAEQIPDTTPQLKETYDFVIIGAGTAGATIAARLSENPKIKVLLIEDGTHESLYMDIPLLAGYLQTTGVSRKYRTKPSDKYCLGMEDNRCNWPTAKILGGSSVINYMIANKGVVEDYDRWAEMGNEGWAYKDVLEYFKKLEKIEIPELKSDTIYHGTDGPVHVTRSSFHTLIAEGFLKAGEELGYSTVDYNGKNAIGFSYVQSTIMNGTRMSSNRAYLIPARDRKNLHVTLESTATKVLIDSNVNRAVGVEFTKNGRNITVFASKEVIVSAGAIGSSQLLMLSGIGPAKQLTELGIDVVKDAPVGENLMDHVTFFGLTWKINASISLNMLELINPLNPYISDFLVNREGPLTSAGGCDALGFINTKHRKKHSGLPDIELLFGSATFKEEYLFPEMLNLKKYLRQEWGKYAGTYGWSIAITLSKPKSRGRIKLVANNINVAPEIVPNYFDDPDDMKTMIAGIRAAQSLSQTKVMQAYDSRLLNITYEKCNYEEDSDAYWECVVRTISSTLYHYSGTCKMGARGDPTAVVDPKLKVIGIENLRVADASVLPEIVSAHLNLPVFMIAEKVADMIKTEWKIL
ncbi:hypothetical protein PUN28_005140 [Cardiocondyla obscurior]